MPYKQAITTFFPNRVIAERQNYLLFDRMLCFHVQRSVTVPPSAAVFYKGLSERFSERDGMYFLPEQVAEYDKRRMKVKEVLQLELFVKDEGSSIQWLMEKGSGLRLTHDVFFLLVRFT